MADSPVRLLVKIGDPTTAANEAAVSAGGALSVDGPVTNAGTFVVQEDGAALTALQLIDDMIYTDDTDTHATGSSKGAGMMAAAVPTDTAVAANDIGMLAMSLDRRLHVDADITASVALDVSAATVTVSDDGSFSVDVAVVVPGTGATNLGKAEDVPSAGADTGVAAFAVQDAALSALSSVDGDYTWLRVNANGALHVTGGGGGTEFNEDTAHTTGEAGSMIFAVRRDANTTLVDTDSDYAPLHRLQKSR